MKKMILCMLALSFSVALHPMSSPKKTFIKERDLQPIFNIRSVDELQQYLLNQNIDANALVEAGDFPVFRNVSLLFALFPFITRKFNSDPADIINLIQFLLDQKLDPNTVIKDDGSTLLHWAAINWSHDLVKKLVEAGADQTIKNKRGRTPREMLQDKLIDAGCLKIVEMIDLLKSLPTPGDKKMKQTLFYDTGKVHDVEFAYQQYFAQDDEPKLKKKKI